MLTYDMERGCPASYDYLCCIKEDIWNGAPWDRGRICPPSGPLPAIPKVAVATVENAYSQLVAEGWLTPRRSGAILSVPLETGDRPRPAGGRFTPPARPAPPPLPQVGCWT